MIWRLACVVTAALAMGSATVSAQSSPGTGERTDGDSSAQPAGAPAAQAGTTPEAQHAPSTAPARASAERRGLARLSDTWPEWLEVTAAWRGRVESARPLSRRGAPYDGYYVNRLRVGTRVKAGSQVSVVVEGQDSDAIGYDAPRPLPRNIGNRFDLRLGYVEYKPSAAFTLTAGRQELRLGDGRLVGSPDWPNANRTYDAVRVQAGRGRVRVEAFATAPVVVDPTGFDKSLPGERLYAVQGHVARVWSGVGVDPYVMRRTMPRVATESGGLGWMDQYTTGARFDGKMTDTWSANVEWALQRGSVGADSISAWAGHNAFTWRPTGMPWAGRVILEYNIASGDRDPRDGRRQTFDQLYPTNNNRYGQANQVGWRNIHHLGAQLRVQPAATLRLSAGLHDFRLFTRQDAFYAAGGGRVVRAPNATSSHVGWETDTSAVWSVHRDVSIEAGLGVLWAGQFLRETTDVRRFYAPYVLWIVSF